MQETISNGSTSAEIAGSAFAGEIEALKTQFDVFGYMKSVIAQHDFAHFAICAIPSLEFDRLAASSILSSVPPEVIASYDAAGLLRHSAGFLRLRGTTTPFRLTSEEWETETTSPAASRHAAIMRDLGVRQVDYFPVHDADGSRAAVIFMGRLRTLPMKMTMELQMIAIHIYNRLSEIGAFRKEDEVTLTEREVQCLSWTAAGKTSAEIAGILGLSEHTINHYLNHVTKKLNAVNRTQAVVKAMKKGLIS